MEGNELIQYGFKRVIEELKAIENRLERIETLSALTRKDLYEYSYSNRKSETGNGGLEK